MRLSRNFRLEEFLVSQTAERNGIDMSPSESVVENLQVLVETCLQPLRNALGETIFISSGYRPLELNIAIGGSTTSAHMIGNAADFVVANHSPLFVCRRIRNLGLPYDQNIHEFGRWTHLGIARQPRNDDLTAYRREGGTRYAIGIEKIEDLVA